MLEEISEIAAALRSGTATAEAILDRSLERIAEANGALNAFIALDEDAARQAARESDRRLSQGRARSALEGIPLSIKDNILVRGLPATWGNRQLEHFVPDRDELPVERLRDAGAIILGKTNVPEFTLEGYTANDLFGVTRNPWNLEKTPGGSSGGAAASVAAGLVPAALGTDGGGSIRRPACHTGLVGWKPSTGTYPRLWGFPTILSDFEVVGTLSRSVRDAQLLHDVLRTPDVRDRRSTTSEAPRSARQNPRILYVPQFGNSPVDPEVAALTSQFAQGLEKLGCDVTEDGIFFDLDAANGIWRTVSRSGVAYLERWMPGILKNAGASARAMAEEGNSISGAEFAEALERVTALRFVFAELFMKYDFVLTPAAAALPWAAEKPYPEVIDGRKAGPRDHAVFTGWVNIGGLPAISLPAGLSQEGLPSGVQLVGGFGTDRHLLEFAEGLEVNVPVPPR